MCLCGCGAGPTFTGIADPRDILHPTDGFGMEERELLAGLRRGEDPAFAEIFRMFYARLVRVADRVVNDTARAEDVAQEVMLELWRRRAELPDDTRLQAYLFQSTRNRALNQVRHLRVVRQGEPYAPKPSAAPATDAEALAGELEVRARAAVHELPEDLRETFLLNRVDGLTYAECARVLDVSVKTVEARMGKALRRLRERLAPWLPEGRGW
jgi:RNA polymerase sigma-70 factor (ECF subfamily)